MEWVYNGRDEKWKETLVGITLCGVPAVMDFNWCRSREEILTEAKRQDELGLQYAEYSYALRNMSPAQNESLKIVFEHGLELPDNMPEGCRIEWDRDCYTGMLGLFQIIIFEGTEQEPLTLSGVYQGTRYSRESAERLLTMHLEALNELLEPGKG